MCNYCPYCPEIFIEIDDLNNHIKNAHEKEDNPETNGGDLKHFKPLKMQEDDSHSGEFLKDCDDVKKLIGLQIATKENEHESSFDAIEQKPQQILISFEDFRAKVKKLLFKSKLEMIGNTKDNINEMKNIMIHWDQPMDEFLFFLNIYQDSSRQDKIDEMHYRKFYVGFQVSLRKYYVVITNI